MNYIADIHAHPNLKPFGQSFSNRFFNRKKKSIWYYNPPRSYKKLLERLGLAAYRQSDLTSCGKGQCFIVGVSLYPPEVSFFKNRLGDSNIAEGIENLITLFSKKRIQYIQSSGYDYFFDLHEQYDFMKSFHNTYSKNGRYKTILAKNARDIEAAINSNEPVIAMFLNVEGAHSFGIGKPPITPLTQQQETDVLNNVEMVKNWEHKPLFVTFAHHFYNQAAGHAKSLPFVADLLARQQLGMNTGITQLGKKIIAKLLDNTNGKRILIDIKHFSTLARKEFYEILDHDYPNEDIPILFSHGGVCGHHSFDELLSEYPNTIFNNWDINIFDNEIERIVQSNGLIGLNFDQRVMSSGSFRKNIRRQNFLKPLSTRKYNWSMVIWNHIKYLAKKLDEKGLKAWDHICIGSDYDGIINPINYFLSEESMPSFKNYLLKHVSNFMNDRPGLNNPNLLPPEIIVNKIMGENAFEFLKRYY